MADGGGSTSGLAVVAVQADAAGNLNDEYVLEDAADTARVATADGAAVLRYEYGG